MATARPKPLLVLVLLLLTGPVAMTACGDDDDDADSGSDPAAVMVDGKDYAFVMPDRVAGGVVRMDFSNSGRELHEYGLGRLGPGTSFADVENALARGKEPQGVEDIGGVPVLTPGTRISITRDLTPGTYVFICFIPDPKGRPHYELGMKKEFEVEGETNAEPPVTDGVIVAGAKAFKVPEIAAGPQILELRNAASKPREFDLAGLRPGRTEREAVQFFAPLEQGRGFRVEGLPPLELLGAMQSIKPGTSVYLTANFRSGWMYRLADEENGIEARFRVR